MKRLGIAGVLPIIIFLGLAGVFGVGLLTESNDAGPSALIGRPAPALTVRPLGSARMVENDDLRDGTTKLVNFWASWCGPCRAEHPQLMAIAASGTPVVGVNYRDDPEKAQAFLSDLGDPFTLQGADPQARTGLDWGVRGVPETFVIGPDGTVLARHMGPITQRALTEIIQPALAQTR